MITPHSQITHCSTGIHQERLFILTPARVDPKEAAGEVDGVPAGAGARPDLVAAVVAAAVAAADAKDKADAAATAEQDVRKGGNAHAIHRASNAAARSRRIALIKRRELRNEVFAARTEEQGPTFELVVAVLELVAPAVAENEQAAEHSHECVQRGLGPKGHASWRQMFVEER